jgi:hypothetical protein
MYLPGILAAANGSCKDLELAHATVAVRVVVGAAGIAPGSTTEVDVVDVADGKGPKLVMTSDRQGTVWSKEPIPCG